MPDCLNLCCSDQLATLPSRCVTGGLASRLKFSVRLPSVSDERVRLLDLGGLGAGSDRLERFDVHTAIAVRQREHRDHDNDVRIHGVVHLHMC